MRATTQNVVSAVESHHALNSPATKTLLASCVAMGLGELHIRRLVLDSVQAYVGTLPSYWTDQDRGQTLASFVGFLKSEVRGRLRGCAGTPADYDPPGYAAIDAIMNGVLSAWESGDAATLQSIEDGYGIMASAHTPPPHPRWPLRVSPKWYLSRYPDGEYVALAEKLVYGNNGDDPTE